MADNEQSRQPSHRAYSVIQRDGQDDFWLNVGIAFPHKDGKGFNIVLQAFPLDARIVCREFTVDEQTEQQSPNSDPQKRRTGTSRK